MSNILVTLFAATSKAGQELALALKTTLETMKINNFPITMDVISDGDQADLMQAGMRDDIVIFDASIEDATGSNYKAANMWPCIMAHFLVVSRTRLPLNFQTLRDGGTPDTSGEIANRPYFLTNDYLIQWVQDQVRKLTPHIPRPASERLDIPHGRFSQYSEEIKRISRHLLQVSADIFEAERKSNNRAFVSYLSRYSKYYPHRPQQCEGFHVEALVDQIQNSHRERPFPVLYYPPGALSSEFMTEHRRWQVVSIIDRRIRLVDEFYVFETPDYFNSWWTLAELAALAYIRHDDATKVPKIYRCQPQRKGLIITDAAPDFVQKLTDQVARQFGRYLSNSDPFTMGLETIKRMQKVRRLPKFLQWLQFKATQPLSDWLMEFIPFTDEEQHQMQEVSGTFNFDRYREMIYSHVFEDSFWEDRIVTCPICSQENRNSSAFDFNTFLLSEQQGQYRVSQSDLSIILQQHYWKCPKHDDKFQVVKDKDHPQYQWWPVRMGKPTGPEGRYIEKIPIYMLERVGK
jgi:hypothetical protein